MELDQNMSDILVEMLTTHSSATNGRVKPHKAKCKSSFFEIALEKAMKLPRSEAHEIWRVLQLLVSNESLVGQSAQVVLLAMEFNPFPVTWKVLAEKAFEHEHLSKESSAFKS
jgi:hypothetical protein